MYINSFTPSSFNYLMENYNFVAIHQKSLQNLATWVHKVTNDMSPTILNDIVTQRATPYNWRNPVSLKMEKFDLGVKLWSLVMHDIR